MCVCERERGRVCILQLFVSLCSDGRTSRSGSLVKIRPKNNKDDRQNNTSEAMKALAVSCYSGCSV